MIIQSSPHALPHRVHAPRLDVRPSIRWRSDWVPPYDGDYQHRYPTLPRSVRCTSAGCGIWTLTHTHRVLVFSRSQKEQARLLLGSGPLSLSAPMTTSHAPVATADYEFPPLRPQHVATAQHVKASQHGQHTPSPAGLQTPPRAMSRMRLPDSPETPTPSHRCAELGITARNAVATPALPAGATSDSSKSPGVGPGARFGPMTMLAKAGNKISLGTAAGKAGVTSRPLVQQGKGVSGTAGRFWLLAYSFDLPTSRAVSARQPQAATSGVTRVPDRQPEKVAFPEPRPVPATASPGAKPKQGGGPVTCAFGWMATPPESPTEVRPRPKLSAPVPSQSAVPSDSQQTADKGWAQE